MPCGVVWPSSLILLKLMRQHAGSSWRVKTSYFEKSPNNSVPIRNENEIKNILQNRKVQIDTWRYTWHFLTWVLSPCALCQWMSLMFNRMSSHGWWVGNIKIYTYWGRKLRCHEILNCRIGFNKLTFDK